MRGLAFPSDATSNREAFPDEHGTTSPMSLTDDIPIDPALMGEGATVIDPILVAEEQKMMVDMSDSPQFQPENIPEGVRLIQVDESVRHYSQAPEGDPFAPPMMVQVPLIPPPLPLPMPGKPKRKRKVTREEECGHCGGNDDRNTHTGEPEPMATCIECGRSGHPSCLELAHLGHIIRSYPWRCVECKICELCKKKDDDAKILFCDACDRGWHTYCLTPPMDEVPDVKWACPMCPPLEFTEEGIPMFVDGPPYHIPAPPFPFPREASIASTSQSAVAPEGSVSGKPKKKKGGTGRPPGRPKRNADAEPTPKARKPAGRAKKASVPEATADMDVDVESCTEPTIKISRTSKRTRVPSKAAIAAQTQSSDDEVSVSSPTKRDRKKRIRDPSPSQLPRVRLRLPVLQPTPKGKGKEREEEEGPPSPIAGLFDEILSPEDRDVLKTSISRADKVLFEQSRAIAEEKLIPHPPPPPLPGTARTGLQGSAADASDFSTPGPSRPLRSQAQQTISALTIPTTTYTAALSASPVPSTPGPGSIPAHAHGKTSKELRIRAIRFGEYDISTWYDAPFPEEYANIPDGRLWICEFCLKYMKSRFGAVRHRVKCKARNPPGDEIYRDGPISIFEVDGRRNKIYCQNLCLLSKMFLDHKSLFYDVEPFLFYVITEVDDAGARFVGYFSKEKRSSKDYNLSCIMTLPVRQRQGWGNLLIDFSYLLSKKEHRLGSPEKPLSSLGEIGYRKYWTMAVMRFLEQAPDRVQIEDIAAGTSMTPEDICLILTEQKMLFVRQPTPPMIRPSPGQAIKLPKGRKSGAARKQFQRMQSNDAHLSKADGQPFVPPKHYEIHFNRPSVAAYMRNYESKGQLKLRPEKLQWTPYLLSTKNREPPASAAAGIEIPSVLPNNLTGPGMPGTLSPNGTGAATLSCTPSGSGSGSVAGFAEAASDEETKPSESVLNLFSSPPPEASDHEDADDELPQVEAPVKRKPGRKGAKKSPVKGKPKASPAVGAEGTPLRQRRGRQSVSVAAASPQVVTNGTPKDLEPVTPLGQQRKSRGRQPMHLRVIMPAPVPAVEEPESVSVRKLRSGRGKALPLAETAKRPSGADDTPKARKRRRVSSPVPTAALEEEEAEIAKQVLAVSERSESPLPMVAEALAAADSDNQPPATNGVHVNGDHTEGMGSEGRSVGGEAETVEQEPSLPVECMAEKMGSEEAEGKRVPVPTTEVVYINGVAEGVMGMPSLDECGDEDADGEYEEYEEDEISEGDVYSWRAIL